MLRFVTSMTTPGVKPRPEGIGKNLFFNSAIIKPARMSYLTKNIGIRFIIVVLADIFLIIFVLSGAGKLIPDRYNLLLIGYWCIFFLLIYLTFKELKNFSNGYIGELDVKRILSKFPNEYKYFYDVKIGQRGNIDFVVVGPSGVWTIEVKSHLGKITYVNDTLLINGYLPEKNFLSQSYAEAKELEKYLKEQINYDMRVHPVLAFSSKKAYINFGLNPQRGVYVVNASWLPQLIVGHFAIQLNEEQINEVVKILDRKSPVTNLVIWPVLSHP